MIEFDQEQPQMTFWDGVDKKNGQMVGGHYRTARLLLVEAKGVFSTFFCRLSEADKDEDWSGKGRRFRAELSDAVIKKIGSGSQLTIRSVELTNRSEIKPEKK